MSRTDRGAAALMILLMIWVGTFLMVEFGPVYRWNQRRMVERVLAADPGSLLVSGRSLLASRAGFVGLISPSSVDVPIPLRRLGPTRVEFTTNAVALDLSDPANPLGIIVYAPGQHPPPRTGQGRGPTPWIDGLWVYDDGQLEGMELPSTTGQRRSP